MTRQKKIPANKNTKASKKAVRTTSKAASKDAATSPKEGTAKAAPAQEPKAAAAPKAPKEPKVRDPRLPSPGTLMTKRYHDKNFKLKYLHDGIEVDGTHFDSLSAAARHITGAASINGYLFLGLVNTPRKAKRVETAPVKVTKPVEPKIGGDSNAVATPAGQRAALAAAGLVKRGRPISKPRGASTAKGE